jgi:D-amino peptidase
MEENMPKKIYMSVDFEGATGIVSPRHVAMGQSPEFERLRKCWQADVDALVQGALEGGADRILLNESHGTMINLMADHLPAQVEFISGRIKPNFHMCGVDSGCEAAFLFTHSGAGIHHEGVLAHTFINDFYRVKINGQTVGELHMNAALAGYYGVPVALIAGDEQTCREGRDALGDVVSVATKRGLDRYAAWMKSPEVTQRDLREAAKEATRTASRFQPYRFVSPVEMEIEFLAVTAATASSFVPGVERNGPRSIVYRHEDYRTVYHMGWIFQLIAQGNYVQQDRL